MRHGESPTVTAPHRSRQSAAGHAGRRSRSPSPRAHLGQPGFEDDTESGELRYLDRVAVVSRNAGLVHTHWPRAMQAMLAALDDAAELMPDLVIADHGFAGAAGAAGLPVVGFASGFVSSRVVS